MNAAGYRRLVDGETVGRPLEPLRELPEPGTTPSAVLMTCGRCHGRFGEGRENAAFPKLAGQHERYLVAAMRAYARAERHSGIMQPVAAALTPDEWQALGRYFSAFPRPTPVRSAPAAGDAEALTRGQNIAELGVPSRGVPACRECHGPSNEPRNEHYPKLDGQFADYLQLQLRLFQKGQRGGSPYSHLMTRVAARLNEAEMRDVSRYYAALDGRAATAD